MTPITESEITAMAEVETERQLGTAERIVKTHGLTLALAVAGRHPGDVRAASKHLAEQIAFALAKELRRGAEMQRRAFEDHDPARDPCNWPENIR